MLYQLYLFKAVPQKKILTISEAVPAQEKTCDIRTKNIGNVKFVRRFRALSFSYEKAMISVAKRPRPSLRAKIGVNTPGINAPRR